MYYYQLKIILIYNHIISSEVFICKKPISVPEIKPGTIINNVLNNIEVQQKVLPYDSIRVAERFTVFYYF